MVATWVLCVRVACWDTVYCSRVGFPRKIMFSDAPPVLFCDVRARSVFSGHLLGNRSCFFFFLPGTSSSSCIHLILNLNFNFCCNITIQWKFFLSFFLFLRGRSCCGQCVATAVTLCSFDVFLLEKPQVFNRHFHIFSAETGLRSCDKTPVLRNIFQTMQVRTCHGEDLVSTINCHHSETKNKQQKKNNWEENTVYLDATKNRAGFRMSAV